jgi:tetratricopeptide (TPR) repeat protein
MYRLAIAGLWLGLLLAVPGWAQIRSPLINAETEEGKLLQQAGNETDSNKKIAVLEEFLAKFPSHEAAAYVHWQLQQEYLKVNNFDKSMEHGEQAQAKAPDDVQIAHLLVKGAEGKGDAAILAAMVDKAHALALKTKAASKPADVEPEDWKKTVDFATQADQYNEYALYAGAQKQTTPQGKLLLLDALRKDFPGGQFDKTLDAMYVVAYEQLGQNDKMLQAAQAALANDPTNEGYLYLIGESNSDPKKGKLGEAAASAQKILASLPGKPKPPNMSDEEWAKHKARFLGLAHSLLGRTLANQGKFGPAYKELVAAVGPLKGNNEALAQVLYFLGFCSIKLERQREAVTYLTQASKIPGPYQQLAADLLGKVRAALAGR